MLLLMISSGLAAAKENALVGVKVIPLPDSRIRMDFKFTQSLKQMPASFVTQKPSRLVLDFVNSSNKLPRNMVYKNIDLSTLQKYRVVGVGNRVRAILDLTDSVAYTGHRHGKTYSLTISGKVERISQPKREIFVSNAPVNAKYYVNDLRFRGTGKKAGRLIIDLSKSGTPVDVTQVGKNITIELKSTRLSKKLSHKYDVRDFHTPANLFIARQKGNSTQIVLKNKGDYGHFAYQVDNHFIVDVFPLTEEEIKAAKLKKKVFTGKRISLNFQNIPVRSVLQLLADFTGINMVVSDTVSGNITIRLNEVPWDQALDIILTTRSLDKRRNGNVMLIAPASEIMAREKKELESKEEVKKLAPLRSDLIQINYAKAIEIANLIKDKSNTLLSSRGTVSVDARTNTIWIQDTSSKIEEMRELITKLDIPVKQVLIESRIVTVNKDFSQDIGIRFGVSRPTHLSGTLAGANQLEQGVAPANVAPLSNRLNLDLAAAPVSGTPASIGIALAKLGDDILLDLELSAIETESRGQVIASPRLITTNQQAAVIESGQEIPYQQATSSGATAVAFKKAVLSLKVTPQITPDGKIMMELQINQDIPSTQTFNGVPAINTKEIQTNVLVNNGQTIVLGGIYEQDKSQAVNRVPFLGELPLVGHLFRNRTVSVENEELLIFITPKIITNTLTITTVEGRGKSNYAKVELDKFGKPVRRR